MKSLPTSILLVVAAVMQSLGIFRYNEDAMIMSGQVFFPILFALMSIYVSFKNQNCQKFSTVHLLILILAVLTFVLTIAGSVGRLYYFYPSIWVYYAAFALLAIDLGFRIAAMPKAKKTEKPAKRRRQKVAARSADLVATVKSSEEPQGQKATDQ